MDLIEAVRVAGVVGAGGAGFPTHIKLNGRAECLIINAAECEPLIETDKYLCRTFADMIIDAAAVVGEHLGAYRVVVALKEKYEAEIASLWQAVLASGKKVEIVTMPAFYPAGDEQLMVQFVTGRSVPERGLPLDVGAVVDNVGTMLNIYYAQRGVPVTDKFISLTGEVKRTVMLEVPIGTRFTECLSAVGTRIDDYALLVGGPMMGRILVDRPHIESGVVTKLIGNITVLPKDHYLVRRTFMLIERIRHQSRSACIQCRMCTDLCPRYLIGHEIRPHLVMRNLWRESSISDNEEYVRCFGDALNCCDCGLCEMFSCPMGLSPRKVNVYFKQQLSAKGLNKERNMHPAARTQLPYRRVPTERLTARLGLSSYYISHAHECIRLVPDDVYIPFRQHIGNPAVPLVKEGDTVQRGTLIASAADGVSANIHSSIDGHVREVRADGVHLCSREG